MSVWITMDADVLGVDLYDFGVKAGCRIWYTVGACAALSYRQ